MKKKVKFHLWKKEVSFKKVGTGYQVSEGFEWWQTTSEHGRSKGEIKCPCCENVSQIYLWSFRGGGKRCDKCGVFIGSGGAFIMENELTVAILVKESKFINPFKK